MARIAPLPYEAATPEVQELYREVEKVHGTLTNMKATLIRSPAALKAVLEWYTLFDEVKPVIGERRAILFCDAISRENACVLCSTFMHRSIVKGGEDHEHLVLDEKDEAIIDFGRQLAKDANRVSSKLFARLEAFLSPKEIIDLTVFGALMIVNNVFNSALQIDVDASLENYTIQPEIAFSGSSHYQPEA